MATGLVSIAVALLFLGCGGGGGGGDVPPDGSAGGGATVVARAIGDSSVPDGSVAGSAVVHPPAPVSGDAAAALALPDSACPMTGQWRLCSVAERLERSGFVLSPLPEPVTQKGMTVMGSAYLMGKAEVQLFILVDSASAMREAASLDVGDARPVAAEGILRRPAVIRANNLVALVFNNNDRQLERVQLALAAGLPAG